MRGTPKDVHSAQPRYSKVRFPVLIQVDNRHVYRLEKARYLDEHLLPHPAGSIAQQDPKPHVGEVKEDEVYATVIVEVFSNRNERWATLPLDLMEKGRLAEPAPVSYP